MRPSGSGAGSSDLVTHASSSVVRVNSATSGTWTRSSFGSQGERHYLWRAVDQDGDVTDILVHRHRNTHAARRFFRKLLKGQKRTPLELVTDRF